MELIDGVAELTQISSGDFRAVKYGQIVIYFDNQCKFHDHFGHTRRTKRFKYYQNLVKYVEENPSIKLYFTLDPAIASFVKVVDGFLINMDAYQLFCRSIERKTEGRLHAFLGQNLDVLSTEERSEFIRAHATDEDVKEALKGFDPQTRENVVAFAKSLPRDQDVPAGSRPSEPSVTVEEFLVAFSKFASDPTVQTAFLKKLPQIQIETLKSHVEFLRANLNQNETFIQNWIDEEDHKHRKKRCLIFGIEYVDPKREGFLNSKRFDILAEQNRNHHVIIELKSPDADIFKVEESANANGGKNTTYNLSPDLSRAIPQVLSYKDWYERTTPEELQGIGIVDRKRVSKCIIVIGQNKPDDEVWMSNLSRLRSSLSGMEIWTYTDLIEKLENTIANLEQNL
ncbi:MAG: hypothetical protein UX04_C0002G0220 [Microgenomates group bacterium GW2011_GWF2_45_18]|nr:MAG: hypothetical protein UW18_C0003G0342 [Microgenomates group bacterium GW2011_GWF1_44_10]KKU02077.1 MAG: hypothetical protein UX04_C0002G0220 [Microgenomates group bacterium GW2011_GWF2_45_18]HAU98630.1 hypothetical protein [Candidatus Paceibacterota bacterium]HAX01499.1 hypothetical protein [Candidatus Paceibacterota bacterium]